MVTTLRSRQIIIFVTAWLAYATTYFLRKPIGIVKADMGKELSLSNTDLGWLDTALLLPYAVFQMVLAPLGDKYGARRTFGVCLILSGLSMFTFGWWESFPVLLFLLFLNGSAQSLCWPAANKGLGAWITDSQRNRVFGWYGTCPFIGGIVGTAFSVYLLANYGWRGSFLIPSCFVILGGVAILLLFKQPSELGIEVPGKEMKPATESRRLSMLEIWRIPMVVEVAIAVFCLKVVRYCMYMWLPMYLLHHLNYPKEQAGLYSTTFEIGGVLGSFSIGIILDRCFRGKSLWGCAVGTLLSAVALLFFHWTSSAGMIVNSFWMVVAGALNCGPDIILASSIPTELGEMDGRNAASALTGMINGFGSIGTFMEGPIIGYISEHYGFSSMFYSMILLSLIGGVAVIKAAIMYDRKPRSNRALP